MARSKRENESMTTYYHHKADLCARCDIKEERAVQLIVDGLPEVLKVNAHAVRCATPELLYKQLSSRWDQYDATRPTKVHKQLGDSRSKSFEQNSRRETASTTRSTEKQEEGTQQRRLTKCFKCQKYGTHTSAECKQPRVSRCHYYQQVGHIKANCPKLEGGAKQTAGIQLP